MPTSPHITFRPVDKTNWSDFERFFESKGCPGYCWCMAFRMTKEEQKQNDPQSRKGYIKERVWSETPIGLLAYSEDRPIAWCSVAPRESYRRLGGDANLESVWSIACFFIKREFRERGLVARLIEEAKKYARKNGAKHLEAYPVEPESPSYRFMGFIQSFEKAGFRFVKMAGTRRHVMTCEL